MSNRATITREQFLQQRKEVARVSRRKSILPSLLFIIPLFMFPFFFSKEKLPISSRDWLLFWSLGSAAFVGMLWTYYRMYADAKLNALHCPSCGKNNGGPKASQWLTATGKCFRCGEGIFQQEQTEKKPLISREAFEHRLKRMDSQLGLVSLCAGIPFMVALIAMNYQDPYFTDIEPYMGPLLISCIPVLIVVVWLTSRIEKRSGTQCPECNALTSNHRRKITLATSNCAVCGHGVFENNPSSSPA